MLCRRTLFIRPIYTSLHLLTPTPHAVPPPAPFPLATTVPVLPWVWDGWKDRWTHGGWEVLETQALEFRAGWGVLCLGTAAVCSYTRQHPPYVSTLFLPHFLRLASHWVPRGGSSGRAWDAGIPCWIYVPWGQFPFKPESASVSPALRIMPGTQQSLNKLTDWADSCTFTLKAWSAPEQPGSGRSGDLF